MIYLSWLLESLFHFIYTQKNLDLFQFLFTTNKIETDSYVQLEKRGPHKRQT